MDQERDAWRRTLLANERTFLAWWRGALTALAVALGAGALVPTISGSARWPFVGIGVGFGLLAIAFIVYGTRRHAAVERAVAEGGFAPLDRRVVAGFAVLGVLLALLTIAAVLTEL